MPALTPTTACQIKGIGGRAVVAIWSNSGQTTQTMGRFLRMICVSRVPLGVLDGEMGEGRAPHT